jgi:hypothetical protein
MSEQCKNKIRICSISKKFSEIYIEQEFNKKFVLTTNNKNDSKISTLLCFFNNFYNLFGKQIDVEFIKSKKCKIKIIQIVSLFKHLYKTMNKTFCRTLKLIRSCCKKHQSKNTVLKLTCKTFKI